VGAAAHRETFRSGLEHETHRRCHRAKPFEIRTLHDPGIQMREQSGFAKHQVSYLLQILERGLESMSFKRAACNGVTHLRFVAEGKERLLATRRLAGADDAEDILRREKRACGSTWRLRKRAVMTHVTTKLCQRNKNFSRVGH